MALDREENPSRSQIFESHRGHVRPVHRIESSKEWRSVAKLSQNKH